jgi:hypothetical protein
VVVDPNRSKAILPGAAGLCLFASVEDFTWAGPSQSQSVWLSSSLSQPVSCGEGRCLSVWLPPCRIQSLSVGLCQGRSDSVGLGPCQSSTAPGLTSSACRLWLVGLGLAQSRTGTVCLKRYGSWFRLVSENLNRSLDLVALKRPRPNMVTLRWSQRVSV